MSESRQEPASPLLRTLRKIPPAKAAWMAIYLFVAMLVTHAFATFWGLHHYPPASLEAFLNGTAKLPFATRALVPWLVGQLDLYLPDLVKQALWLVGDQWLHPNVMLDSELILCAIAFGCYLAAGFGGRRLYRFFFGGGEVQANLAGLAYLLGIPLWFRYFNYAYDPATLAFSTWLLIFAVQRRVWAFALLFALATVNKETTILVLPVLGFCLWREWPRFRVAALIAGLVGVYAAIRLPMRAHFADRPGHFMEPHFWDHQMALASYWPIVLYSAVVMFTLIGLARVEWKQKPAVLRLGLLCTLLPLFVLAIFWGFIDEIRAFYDAYPYLTLLALPSLFSLLGMRSDPPAESVPQFELQEEPQESELVGAR